MYINLKTRNSKIKDYTLCLVNISKDFTFNNMAKTGLKGIVIFFVYILLILIIFYISIKIWCKEHDIKQCLG